MRHTAVKGAETLRAAGIHTVDVVDLQPGQVFGGPVLGGRQKCRIVDWKIPVVVL